MITQENPASRLYHILLEAKKQPPSHSIGQVWSNVFKLEPGNTVEVFKIIISLCNLVDEIKELIVQDSEIDDELYLEHFPKIELVLKASGLTGSWSTVRDNLDDATLYSLKHCSNHLSKKFLEYRIEADSLEELIQLTNQFIEIVNAKIVNIKLKRVILDRLESIRNAIVNYRISGLDGLQKALEVNLGFIYSNKESLRESCSQDLLEQYSKIVEFLQKVISVAAKTKSVVGTALNLLKDPNSS